jgi:hypothetical protein
MPVAAITIADDIRRSTLKRLLRIPLARSAFISPSKRIPIAQFGCVTMAFLAAVLQPILALSVGASLFGAPHLVSGARHLAIRRSLHPLSRAMAVVTAGLGLLLLLGFGRWTIQAITVCFAASVGAEIATAPSSAFRRTALLTVLAAATLAALRFHVLFLVAVTHLHAVGSIAFFAVAARRRGVSALPIVVGSIVVTVLVLSGVVDGLLRSPEWARSFGPDAVVDLLGAPFEWASRALLQRSLALYAFGQSLHYMVWLRLMPEIDRRAPTPSSFRQAFQLLKQDFGSWTIPLLGLCVVSCTAMLFGGQSAREAYFALAYFHIGLEGAGFTRAVIRPRERRTGAFPTLIERALGYGAQARRGC